MKKKKVCIVSGTRADYGLLRKLISLLNDSDKYELQFIVTGAHLSKKFGETYKEIEKDGFTINYKIDLHLSNDTPIGIGKSTSIGVIGFGEAFETLKPDLLIVLGDRYEILAAVISAMFARIPIAHLHGGELTEGAIDDGIRHSITKLSHTHFVSTEEYRNRVIQLGEDPNKVFNVGGLGVDSIKSEKLLSRSDLEKVLNIKFSKKNLLITFHPVTLEKDSSSDQVSELLNALMELNDTTLIFTMPNADLGNNVIFNLIKYFVDNHEHAYSFNSLGQQNYFSCISHVDAVVGNSSSGILEVPTFKKGTINIGDRQKGRVQAKSVINCSPTKSDIQRAIDYLYSNQFQNSLAKVKNPYGDGGASKRIINILNKINFEKVIKKEFFDLKMSE